MGGARSPPPARHWPSAQNYKGDFLENEFLYYKALLNEAQKHTIMFVSDHFLCPLFAFVAALGSGGSLVASPGAARCPSPVARRPPRDPSVSVGTFMCQRLINALTRRDASCDNTLYDTQKIISALRFAPIYLKHLN